MIKFPTSKIRKYTDTELRHEAEEYFGNQVTKKAFPDLFKTQKEFADLIRHLQYVYLTDAIWRNMVNTDADVILQAADKFDTAGRLAKQYHKDILSVFNGLMYGKLPPPIVIRKDNRYHLMAGNTRIMAAIAVGYNMPVYVIEVKKKK